MITERTDMPNQLHRRTGQLVADHAHVSPSLVAQAAFVCAPAKPLTSNRMPPNSLRLAESPFRKVVPTAASRANPDCTKTGPAVVPAAYVITYATGALRSRSSGDRN